MNLPEAIEACALAHLRLKLRPGDFEPKLTGLSSLPPEGNRMVEGDMRC